MKARTIFFACYLDALKEVVVSFNGGSYKMMRTISVEISEIILSQVQVKLGMKIVCSMCHLLTVIKIVAMRQSSLY